jgi:hypothetical protein
MEAFTEMMYALQLSESETNIDEWTATYIVKKVVNPARTSLRNFVFLISFSYRAQNGQQIGPVGYPCSRNLHVRNLPGERFGQMSNGQRSHRTGQLFSWQRP